MEQELRAVKFSHYVNKIANLDACLIDKTKRHKREIASYKGKLTMAKNELSKFKPFSGDHPSYLELFKEFATVCGNNNALKIGLSGLKTENERLKSKMKIDNKGEMIALNLNKIQKELENIYTAIGAVMAYANDDDRFFMNRNEILKDK